MATYNPAKNVWENEGGYTDWSAFDPSAAAAAGMSPIDILNMAQNAGLGTGGPVFGGQNDIPSNAARNIFSSQWFQSLDPTIQQQLLQNYKSSHSDSGWGSFLGALGVAAAPFALGAMTGTLGEGGLGAFTPSALDAAQGVGVANAGAMDAAINGMSVPGASLGAGTAGAGSGGLIDLGGGLAIDASGNVVSTAGAAGAAGAGGSLLSGAGSVLSGANSLFGGSSGILGSLGDIASGSMSLLPGMLALNYARNNAGIDTSNLSGILGKLQGNQDAVISAATDPLQRNIAAGYGDLLQSQAARGIRGSSFGDTDIANYIANTGTALSNAGANAAEGSLSLQGNLASQIAQLQNQSQQQKNTLYGTAFDALGRALNPAGYAGSINVPGTGTTSNTSNISGINQLLTGLGSLGKTVVNGIGGLFGGNTALA